MRKFLIGTHGRMASGIKSSVDILLGNSDAITVIDAYIDDTNIKDVIEAYLASVSEEDQVIMMSDIYGGSVNQVMFQYAHRPNTFLISGINLALVLELCIGADMPVTKEEIEDIIIKSKEGMSLVSVDKVQEQQADEEDFF